MKDNIVKLLDMVGEKCGGTFGKLCAVLGGIGGVLFVLGVLSMNTNLALIGMVWSFHAIVVLGVLYLWHGHSQEKAT